MRDRMDKTGGMQDSEGSANADRGGGAAVPERPARIIDSWLMRDGLVLRPDLHVDRTARAIERRFGVGPGVPTRDDLALMIAEGNAVVPEVGAWFPLLEIGVDPEQGIVVAMQTRRPAPALRCETRLAIARDRRRFPTFKGADADVTAADRGAAQDAGDDDAIYLDGDGRVLEAANGAVVAWRGDELLVPDARDRVLESTTVGAMLDHLRGWRAPDPWAVPSPESAHIVEATRARWALFRPDEVDELWYVNALHGITPVVALDGEERPWSAGRLAAWTETARSWWEPT